MRKLLLTTAATLCLAVCCAKMLTDYRDGQTYRTVVMPDGKRWMAKNLNYQTDSSWCYENSADSCEKYGRLYDWKTATTVCPAGWKLPDTAGWNRLLTKAGGWEAAGKKLKSKSGWVNLPDKNSGNGTDKFGFSVLPGGSRDSYGGFYYAGYYGVWWTATEEIWSINAYYRYVDYHYDHVYEDIYDKDDGYSVRCVADSP
jgi:uncharacterized protein (TIGR02145 family)